MTEDFRSGADDGTRNFKQSPIENKGAFADSKKHPFQDWWDSDACKQFQKAHQEDLQRAVGKYHMLSENDKIDMVQAICYIMCKAEQDKTSHRGLQSALGIYPGGFWVDYLMDVHNALWDYYHEKDHSKQLNDDLDALDNIIN